MTLKKLLNGVEVDLTPEEIQEISERVALQQSLVLPNTKKSLLELVNNDDNSIYSAAIGNKLSEYQIAEIDALTYKTSGYTGVVAESIQSWADAKNWTAKQAADDILQQAQVWRWAQGVIRRNRLKAKEDIKSAPTKEQADIVYAEWKEFVVYIRNLLGIPL